VWAGRLWGKGARQKRGEGALRTYLSPRENLAAETAIQTCGDTKRSHSQKNEGKKKDLGRSTGRTSTNAHKAITLPDTRKGKANAKGEGKTESLSSYKVNANSKRHVSPRANSKAMRTPAAGAEKRRKREQKEKRKRHV